MILREVFYIALFAHLTLGASTKRKERHELSISECAAKVGECDETKGRPVCGTDDQTYPTRCHLLRVQCSGHQVSLKYRGSCRACKEARDYAIKHKSKNPPNFIPNCKADGTYAPVQCLTNSGCWCSDITGKPIENTSVRTGKPKCREYSRANRRRSPPRQMNRSRRTCTQLDQVTFNENLLRVFRSEYTRAGQAQQQSQRTALDGGGMDELVLNWKFAQLDANENQMLDKNEFRELKKLVKRAVKPRRCGRAFGKFCDVSGDDRLTRSEWNSCLANDGRKAAAAAVDNTSASAADNDSESSQQSFHDYDEDYDSEDGDEDEDSGMLSSRSSQNYVSIHILNPKSESSTKESDIESDCWADKAAALEEQTHGGTALYVPDCTPDGRYQQVQCYRSTPYCWCVNEDTGKNIPGTSVKYKRPQCDTIVPSTRPMKGCSEPSKVIFLKELKEFLKTQILSGTSTSSLNSTKWNSEDERIATLSFLFLDKNKNKSWERKEWKVFRERVTSVKNLRKCGKRLPRYCDVNSDKKISLTEWLHCLQTQRVDDDGTTQKPTQTNETVTTKTRRTGSNPLEQYLKD